MGSLTKATTETFGTGGVNSTNIQNEAITNAKIASDAAIANSKLSITFPTISSLSITNGQPAVYDTETVDINGTDFTNGARVDFIHSTTNAVINLPTVTFVSATQLRVTIPASTLTEGTDYKIRVSNPDGLAATSTGTVLYSETVSFSTASGSLGSVGEGESASFSVSASSNSTIAYSVTSGSLPTGLSLNSSTGAITGTAPTVAADTTSTFTITATDAESQTASRSFSITVTNFAIDNSLRFNDNDSAYLNRTPSGAGNRRTFTLSVWFKLTVSPAGDSNYERQILSADDGTGGNNNFDYIAINHSGQIFIYGYEGAENQQLRSTQVLRDASAWYHLVVAFDTTQATSSNRIKVYLNGNQVTDFATANYPSLNFQTRFNNTNPQYIGKYPDSNTQYFDGYMAEYHLIDGQALTPTDFGETDSTTNNWIPKKYSGSHGTNGFYLDFSNSADLGNDSSGNNNDFTPNNLAATDQTTDTPTNNFATWNSVGRQYGQTYVGTFSEGNTISASGGNATHNWGTIPITSTTNGWYWECKCTSLDAIRTYVGIIDPSGSTDNSNGASYDFLYKAILASSGSFYDTADGQAGSSSASFTSYAVNDIIQIAYKNGSIWFGKNGTWMNSGDPSAGTGAVATDVDTTKTWIPYAGYNSTWSINFGNPSFSISSGNSDENGYGNFEYEPPTGFLALCTNNLPNPAIADPTEHFNTVLYSGNSGTQSITGVGFQPDWVWIKARNQTYSHRLIDSTRGGDKGLRSSDTSAETTVSGALTSFDSDGFSLGFGTSETNNSAGNYVAWNWKANAGSTSSNTDGSVTSTVQANTTAGFSIVTWTETTANSQTIGHGLGKTPAMIITKLTDDNVLDPAWYTFHQSIGTGERIMLDSTSGDVTSGFFNGTLDSSVFHVGYGDSYDNKSVVAYCFAEIEGYSKFGSYTGNGANDGPFVYTGFKPAWLITKRTDSTSNWVMHDNTRDPLNESLSNNNGSNARKNLYANLSNTEDSSRGVNFYSNGFKVEAASSDVNGSGATYIYMAFAEAPFKSGTGATTIEGTAR